MNNVILMGRLATEPALKTTATQKKVCTFTIAVRRPSAEGKVDFIRCQAWERTGEFIAKYFAKGRMIAISGRLQTENWEDRDTGARKSITQVVVNSAYFTGEKADGAPANGTPKESTQSDGWADLDDLPPEEELPF